MSPTFNPPARSDSATLFPGFRIGGQRKVFHCFLPPQVAEPLTAEQAVANRDWFTQTGLEFFKLSLFHLQDDAAVALRLERGRTVAADKWVLAAIHIDSIGDPWHLRYPDECILFDDGSRGDHPSFASEVWRETQAEPLRRTLRLLRETFGERLVGASICAGALGEWGLWGEADYRDGRFRCSDWSAPMLRAWRAWIGDSAAMPPSRRERMSAPGGDFREPSLAERTAEWYRCVGHEAAKSMDFFNRVAREAMGPGAVVGNHGAAWLDVGLHIPSQVQTVSALAGSEEVRRFRSADFMATPHSYLWRDFADGDVSYMVNVESLRLHGALYLNEADERTHLNPGNLHWVDRGLPRTTWETEQVFKRNAAEAIVRGAGMYWYDIYGGGFGEPSLGAALARLRQISQALAETQTWSPAQVAFIMDGASCLYQAAGSSLLQQILYRSRLDFWNRAGITWDSYELHDFLEGAVPSSYQALVFLNTWRLTGAQRGRLRERVDAAPAKLVVWCVAPGYQTERELSLDAVRELTRFEVQREDAICDSTILFRDQLLAFNAFAKDTHEFNCASAFHVVPGQGEQVLATWDSLALPAVVRRGREVYWAAPILHSKLLREVCRDAGLHIYIETDDAMRSRSSFTAVTARSAGAKVLIAPAEVCWCDVYSGEHVLSDSPRLELTMQRGETRMLAFGTAEAVRRMASITAELD